MFKKKFKFITIATIFIFLNTFVVFASTSNNNYNSTYSIFSTATRQGVLHTRLMTTNNASPSWTVSLTPGRSESSISVTLQRQNTNNSNWVNVVTPSSFPQCAANLQDETGVVWRCPTTSRTLSTTQTNGVARTYRFEIFNTNTRGVHNSGNISVTGPSR